eukprot:TRINITY_DN6257_c0_g3_i7.p1 TRINITY_DN6257_c0_g3~~TRINITY_DN6257_c0_g3_i7.p1  ORF type:complete len:495 (-),score=107.55 TRINITY_DN6257_c0_g3_i7:92-1576(-)
MNVSSVDGQWLYHEKQVAGLCGVHTLNNLFQASLFTEVDLMQIAQDLDAEEKRVMSEMGTETPHFLKFVAEDSGNVALDGNFSSQVLKKALEGFDLRTWPITHPDMNDARQNPQYPFFIVISRVSDFFFQFLFLLIIHFNVFLFLDRNEMGFICHLHNHWFSIRKIGSCFWDLNSLHQQPVYLSELHLGVYLKQLQLDGYTIYVVRGQIQEHYTSDWGDKNWTFALKKPPKRKNIYETSSGQDDLYKAIQMSLSSSGGSGGDSSGKKMRLTGDTTFYDWDGTYFKAANKPDDFDSDLMQAIAASLDNPSVESPSNHTPHMILSQSFPLQEEEDDGLKEALLLSLQTHENEMSHVTASSTTNNTNLTTITSTVTNTTSTVTTSSTTAVTTATDTNTTTATVIPLSSEFSSESKSDEVSILVHLPGRRTIFRSFSKKHRLRDIFAWILVTLSIDLTDETNGRKLFHSFPPERLHPCDADKFIHDFSSVRKIALRLE